MLIPVIKIAIKDLTERFRQVLPYSVRASTLPMKASALTPKTFTRFLKLQGPVPTGSHEDKDISMATHLSPLPVSKSIVKPLRIEYLVKDLPLY